MVDGIVLQLQAEALDESVDIETLLRKAYLVSRKLQLKDFESWILCEQNGYRDNLPDYRKIGGEIRAWNPYYGWIPVVMRGKTADICNQMSMSQPIATILDAYNSSDDSIAFSISHPLTDLLNNNSDGFQTVYRFCCAKTELRKIISAVRNRILEWSILLEENGIIGDGLNFSGKEKKAAKESKTINNYTNNFYSSVDRAQIQQSGSGDQQ